MGGFGSGMHENLTLRFFRKITKDSKECWVFTSKSKHYVSFNFKNKIMGAHRASYLLFIGKIPKGKLVLHLCDNKKCVNPDHLTIGTAQDNTNDMISKGRACWQIKRKKCIKNHSLVDGSNVYVAPSGRRLCRICRSVDDKKFKKNKKALSCSKREIFGQDRKAI